MLRTAARISILLLLPLLLSGCQWLTDLRERLLSQGEKTVTNVTEQAMKTKESVEQKIEDVRRAAQEVEEAAKEVDEAIAAVKKVTGGSEGGAGTGTTPGTAAKPKKEAPSLAP